MQQLAYPVLIIGRNYIEGGISSSRELLFVGKRQFDDGCFDGAKIVDSSGYIFEILSSRKKEVSWSLCDFLMRRQSVWVDLKFGRTEKKNLDLIRTDLLEIIYSHPDWYRKYDETKESVKKRLESARTTSELINIVSVYP